MVILNELAIFMGIFLIMTVILFVGILFIDHYGGKADDAISNKNDDQRRSD